MAAKKKVNKKRPATKTRTVAGKKTAKKNVPAKQTTVRKKSVKKKTATKKAAATKKRPATKARTVVKKKTAKKNVAAKQTTIRKESVKKKTAAKKAAVTKKRPATKTRIVTKKKTAKKNVAAKQPAVRKKSVKKKTAAKKAAVTKTEVIKSTPAKKASTKKTAQISSGKAKITELKNKVFRRSPTDVQSFKPYSPERGEEYMNTTQSAHFRNILLDWKKVLMEEVDRTVHHMQDDAANFPDPNDRATQEEEFALELRTRDRERKLIRKIDEAILSLETGDYGYCEVCGIEIGVKRLEARPTATLCIDCKTLDEIKEKQLG